MSKQTMRVSVVDKRWSAEGWLWLDRDAILAELRHSRLDLLYSEMRVYASRVGTLTLLELQAAVDERLLNGARRRLDGTAAESVLSRSAGTSAFTTTFGWLFHLVREVDNPMFVFALASNTICLLSMF